MSLKSTTLRAYSHLKSPFVLFLKFKMPWFGAVLLPQY